MPRESEQVVVGEALIAEKNHIVAIPRGFDGVGFGIAQASEIYALDLRAEQAHLTHLDLEYGRHTAVIIAKDVEG